MVIESGSTRNHDVASFCVHNWLVLQLERSEQAMDGAVGWLLCDAELASKLAR